MHQLKLSQIRQLCYNILGYTAQYCSAQLSSHALVSIRMLSPKANCSPFGMSGQHYPQEEEGGLVLRGGEGDPVSSWCTCVWC